MTKFLLFCTLLTSALGVFPAGASAEESSKPVIIDFQAKWCRPCKELRPVLTKIEKKYNGRIDVITVDVDDPANRPLIERYAISVLPTVVFVSSSGQTSITTGYSGEENIYWGLKTILP